MTQRGVNLCIGRTPPTASHSHIFPPRTLSFFLPCVLTALWLPALPPRPPCVWAGCCPCSCMSRCARHTSADGPRTLWEGWLSRIHAAKQNTHTHTHTHTPANRTLLYSKTMTDFRKLFQVEHSFYTFRQRHSTHKHSIHCIIKITHANTYSLESSGIWGNLSLWMSLLIWLFGGVTRTVRIYPVHLKCNVKRQHFCCEVQSHYITIAVFPPNNWHPQPSSHSNSFW